MDYGVLKSIHIIAVISWMAALLYIGRIFVYWVESNNNEVKNTLYIMANRLQRYIGLPASIIATIVGLYLGHIINAFSFPWFHYKLFLLILVFGYQHACGKILKKIKNNSFNRSPRWCRMFNEVPTILLIGIVFSVITKQVLISIIAPCFVLILLLLFFSVRKKS